jgi:cytoskeletal protein CcmA (bactofilin family)
VKIGGDMNNIVKGVKNILAHLARGESGRGSLEAVLILLILGALIITPILAFMGTGLKAGQTHESRTEELYAADAGWNSALRHAKEGEVPVGGLEEEFTLNDRTVQVTIEVAAEDQGNVIAYKITSTATSDTGSSTTVESYLNLFPFDGLLDNAITSASNVTIRPGSEVYGDVQYGGTLDNSGDIYGEEIPNLDNIAWPPASVFSEFYRSCLEDEGVDPDDPLQYFPYNTIDLKYWGTTLGPLFRNGDLTIKNTASTPDSVNLTGTIYVTGNLVVQQTCTINLDQQVGEQTIAHNMFAEGTISINPGAVLEGSGCIVAVGDVNFQPNLPTGADDFIFLMSVEGTVKFQPGNDFYGSVAGTVDVFLQPEVDLIWWDGNDGLNFPGGGGVVALTYTIYNH